MANTKCEGCGEQHNARKATDGERLVARRVELASNGQTCAEVSRGSDGQARAALRASEGRACKRAVQKGWCALDEGKQKQAAATAAVQRLADTPRKLLHTPTKNTFFLSFASNSDGGETRKTESGSKLRVLGRAVDVPIHIH